MSDKSVAKIDMSESRNAFLSAGDSLKFSQDAAASVLQACEELLVVLSAATQSVGRLELRSGFDGIASAGQLASGLSDRAEGGEASLKDALVEHRATVQALRDAVVKASHGFLSTEEQNTISQKAAGYTLPAPVGAGDVKFPEPAATSDDSDDGGPNDEVYM